VNGAFMKLQNFKAVDPDYTAGGRTGLGAGATERERTLFDRYTNNRDELHELAQEIRRRVDEGGEALPTAPEEDEAGVVEGRVRYRVHKTRERRRSEEKKRDVLHRTGRLECEVCAFDFEAAYGELGYGFAECHHKLPLSDGKRTTYLRDVAIVCSNCHRMLHRGDFMSIDALRRLINTFARRRGRRQRTVPTATHEGSIASFAPGLSYVIHEGAGRVKGAVRGLGWFDAWSPAAALAGSEGLQSSIRSRWADQCAVRCSGAQTRRRPSFRWGGQT
jgi:5-methylcytosine-specific restriction enzyme A